MTAWWSGFKSLTHGCLFLVATSKSLDHSPLWKHCCDWLMLMAPLDNNLEVATHHAGILLNSIKKELVAVYMKCRTALLKTSGICKWSPISQDFVNLLIWLSSHKSSIEAICRHWQNTNCSIVIRHYQSSKYKKSEKQSNIIRGKNSISLTSYIVYL